MNDSAWQFDWPRARVQAPHQGAHLVRHERNELRCERIELGGGLALCQVRARCDQAITFEAPAAQEPRTHWQFLAHGTARLLDARGAHAVAARGFTLFRPPAGAVAWHVPSQTGVHVISLDLTASALQRWCDSPQAHALVFDDRRPPVVLDTGALHALQLQMRALLADEQARGPIWRLHCESLALQALAIGMAQMGLSPMHGSIGPADLRRLQRVRELLHEAPVPPVTLLALAQAVEMPLRRMQVLYAQHFGEPLRDALYRARLEAARRALLDGDLSIKQIAWRAGFSHATSFTHAFRKHWGEAPSALTSRRPAAARRSGPRD